MAYTCTVKNLFIFGKFYDTPTMHMFYSTTDTFDRVNYIEGHIENIGMYMNSSSFLVAYHNIQMLLFPHAHIRQAQQGKTAAVQL